LTWFKNFKDAHKQKYFFEIQSPSNALNFTKVKMEALANAEHSRANIFAKHVLNYLAMNVVGISRFPSLTLQLN
jgi:hypothetical protein